MVVPIMSGLPFFVVNTGVCRLLKTPIINGSKFCAVFSSAKNFGVPVYNRYRFFNYWKLKGKKKEAKYLFRMFTPLESVFANITKKAKYLFWCFAPLESVSINKKKTAFFSPLKQRIMTEIII